MLARLRSALVVVLLASHAAGQGPQSQPATKPSEPPPTLPWAVKLGLRVEQVNRAFAVVDRVVLVPDAATYLAELSKWSPQGRWPVLIEDDQLAPMFIRRFKPAQVIRRESVGPLTGSPQERRQRLEAVVVHAWGGDPESHTIRDVFEQHHYVPPGVVIASVTDPAWTAAVALAAGRGQPLVWLDERFGRPNNALDRESLIRLQRRIDRLVADIGYPHIGLGDAIDTITLCRSVAGRVNVSVDPDRSEVRAITDLIGRTQSDRRYAFAGWIFGDEVRCAYVAMCSLFLERTKFWLYNTYPTTGDWRLYGVSDAAAELGDKGYDASAFSGDRAGSRTWMNMLPGGMAADVLVMNTKGNVGFFELSSGRGYPGDVPVLNEPLVLHLTHSWSMRFPEDLSTVGGQWLAHGVYAYVGSVHEPYLGAFLPPKTLTDRWMHYVPFLIGARRWEDDRPWKVNTIGDPLMLCPPPEQPPRPRLEPPSADGLDLAEHVKTLMRQAESDDSGKAISEAIRTLNLLGRDGIAIQMWQFARQRDQGSAAAGPAAGPLFRARRTTEFLEAWQSLPYRDHLTTDMLWHLLTPRLGPTTDSETLITLQSAIRTHHSDIDLQRLAPHLTAAFGQAHTRRIIQRELDNAPNARLHSRLQALLNSM